MDNKTTTFTIEVTMENRWIPHFLGMLKSMEYCGNAGISRNIIFNSDGDGDFHPKFNWSYSLPIPIENKYYTFDAG